MKTIEPLFLDELKEEFEVAFDNSRKLAKLLDRIARIKILETFMPRWIQTRANY